MSVESLINGQEELEDVYIDCDGRCLNCDYYEPITGDCRAEID